MSEPRIDSLKQMLQADPQDSFARYALGLEYISAGGIEEAREVLEELKILDPNYLAVYYQLGKVYELLGNENDARKSYEKGIYVAASQSDLHTKQELEEALDGLL